MRRLLIGALALNIGLVAPLWWRYGDIQANLIAWEAWLIVPLMLLMPRGNLRLGLGVALASWVILATLINLGDAATYMAFGRPLNLYLDTPLLGSVYDLLAGNVGQAWAICTMLVAVVLCVLLALGVMKLLLPSAGYSLSAATRRCALAMLLLAGAGAGLALSGNGITQRASLPVVSATQVQWRQLVTTHQAKQAFTRTLEASPIAQRPLNGLAGRRVLMTFIESYGVTVLEDDRYRPAVAPTLDEIEQRLTDRDLAVVSGLLTSPIRGGQSWLAHATALSGYTIDNQLWYQLMLDSDATTLVDDFRATGQRTLAVMPAITQPWPEGAAYGFDELVVAKDIPYAGPPLNWVTMPDQFTLDYTQRQLLDESPVFAKLALISSHAPWTPILPVLDDWSTIGDGAIFAPWEEAGDPPEVLWQDIERIRDHYSWSIDYSIKTVGRWAERVVDDNTLLIVLGDHQPAPLITGDNASGAVPVHIISGDPELLAPFQARGFIPGMWPAQESNEPVPELSQLRRWLHADFASKDANSRTAP
ncbi:alkaline phosphatase [Vreelandella arcis]|uniref:Phosphoglycerol transferase MdoB n=1 Tax=Vreelandella arcis TaxID=416873 RepID=A0A1H0HCC0_9GAMM|nr:alkaline phosphatase [Halomonas arcis]SDO16710.1 Phosphoglycerol transferase MdoB [Halomonas arcis]